MILTFSLGYHVIQSLYDRCINCPAANPIKFKQSGASTKINLLEFVIPKLWKYAGCIFHLDGISATNLASAKLLTVWKRRKEGSEGSITFSELKLLVKFSQHDCVYSKPPTLRSIRRRHLDETVMWTSSMAVTVTNVDYCAIFQNMGMSSSRIDGDVIRNVCFLSYSFQRGWVYSSN